MNSNNEELMPAIIREQTNYINDLKKYINELHLCLAKMKAKQEEIIEHELDAWLEEQGFQVSLNDTILIGETETPFESIHEFGLAAMVQFVTDKDTTEHAIDGIDYSGIILEE